MMTKEMALEPLSEREIAMASDREWDDDTDSVVDDYDEHDEVHGEEIPDVEDSTEDNQQESTSPDWINDEIRGLAKSHALSDDDLKEFSNRQEFERFSRFYDRQSARESRIRKQADPVEQQEPEQEPAGKKPSDEESERQITDEPEQKDSEGLIDVAAYEADGWDENSLKMVRQLRSMQERERDMAAKIEQFERYAPFIEKVAAREVMERDSENQRQLETFRSVVNEHGMADKIFDQDGKPTSMGFDLWATMSDIQDANIARAQREGTTAGPPDMQTLFRRAAAIHEFDTMSVTDKGKEKHNANTEAIRRQSRNRRPVSSSAGTSRRAPKPREEMSEEEEVRSIAQHPDVVKAWESMTRENGAR